VQRPVGLEQERASPATGSLATATPMEMTVATLPPLVGRKASLAVCRSRPGNRIGTAAGTAPRRARRNPPVSIEGALRGQQERVVGAVDLEHGAALQTSAAQSVSPVARLLLPSAHPVVRA
jgi:hypothetical protein